MNQATQNEEQASVEDAVLRVDELDVHYDQAQAVDGASLQLAHGEVACLLGANGAGKSSTLKALAGVVPTSGGRVLLDGSDVTGSQPWHLARLGLSYVPQNRRCFAGLSVEENLLMGALDVPKQATEGRLSQVYDLFPVLADRRDQDATMMSGGQQQMVAIGRGVIGHPNVLLLDEPSLGLSPKIVNELADWIVRIVSNLDMAVLLVEQNVKLAEGCTNRGYLMSQGSIVASGPTEELADKVAEVYLGTTDGSTTTRTDHL